MTDEEYGFKQIKEDMARLKARPYSKSRGGLYALASMAALFSFNSSYNTNKLRDQQDALVRRQAELETICRSNGALRIKNVTGGAGEDVYVEADGKRYFLYIDGKAVENPLESNQKP